MSAGERPLQSVPGWILATLAVALAAQLALQGLRAPPAAAAADLPPAPRAGVLRAASLGEPPALGRLAMLLLQSYDLGAENALPYRLLDYPRLIGWLRAIQDTDPRSDYPLFAAARIYADVEDPEKARAMLAFVHAAFLEDPARRWPAMAHATLLAKHRLKDLPLARRYAVDLERFAKGADVPLWAKQMEVFILEDMNELEAARILLGGMLAGGRVSDPQERRFLQGRLEELERRVSSEPRR